MLMDSLMGKAARRLRRAVRGKIVTVPARNGQKVGEDGQNVDTVKICVFAGRDPEIDNFEYESAKCQLYECGIILGQREPVNSELRGTYNDLKSVLSLFWKRFKSFGLYDCYFERSGSSLGVYLVTNPWQSHYVSVLFIFRRKPVSTQCDILRDIDQRIGFLL